MKHVLAVAGNPVSLSLSPVMHRAALAWSGLTGTYDAIECDGRQFIEVVHALRRGEYTGLNVTMPHKSLAGDLVDRFDQATEVSGSVNTLKMDGGALLGISTDTTAMAMILKELALPDAPVLVLGSGGAAAAMLAAGSGRFAVSSRDDRKARDLAARFPDIDVAVVPFGVGVEGSVVVNATPLGMKGEAIPSGIIENARALIDLPYGARPTPAVVRGSEMGIEVFDGFRFLALQAAASFAWWTGDNVPVEVFEDAARNG